jgi:hypothetical protein
VFARTQTFQLIPRELYLSIYYVLSGVHECLNEFLVGVGDHRLAGVNAGRGQRSQRCGVTMIRGTPDHVEG